MPDFNSTPNADGTSSNIENKDGTETNLYQSVDEGTDTPDDDTSYISNNSVQDGFVFMDLSAMPVDFGSVDTLTISIRRKPAEAVSFNSEDVTFNGDMVSR